MPDIQYFQGGYEEEKHDRALFGLLGGHDEIHIHFNATPNGPAKDVWEQNSQVLGGLLAHSHDLHVHQNAGANGGETDIKVHDGSILGGLVIDDHKSDFKTQQVTDKGLVTRESHESHGSSVGGMLAEGHSCTDSTSIQGADGVTRTETRHESGGSILGGVIGASNNKCETSQVTTPDGKTLTTHYKSDSSGEALLGVAAEGQSHTEYVDNGQGPIGVHTYRGSILGGVVYSGDHGSVYGAELPGASQYLTVDNPYAAIPGAAKPAPTPDVSESSLSGSAIAPAADNTSAAPIAQGDLPATPAPAPAAQVGDLSKDGDMGQAHPQIVKNFNDPDTNQPIPQASVLRFDNGDYFVADGNNVRLVDKNNHRVNFSPEGNTNVAQGASGDDMVMDASSKTMVPRLQAKVAPDGQKVEFDFFNGPTVLADKNGDYVVRNAKSNGSGDSSDDGAPPPAPAQQLTVPTPAKGN
jgi:hypothetical protein